MGDSLKNPEIMQIHDKGYKELYANKEVLLDLLQKMLKLDWAKDIALENMVKIDKSYVTPDYEKKELDILYRLTRDGENHNILIYMLLEFQSTVDYTMPMRLFMYTGEILREYMKGRRFSASDSKFRIPYIFPIVLYNGREPWKAGMSLGDVTGREKDMDLALDLKYSLLDINHSYTEEDLLHNDCITSMVFLLDQRTDIKTMIKRVNDIRLGFKSIDEGKNRQIISDWVGKTFYPELAETAVKLLNAEQGEATEMIINNTWKIAEDLIEKGRKEGVREGVREGLEKGVREGLEKGVREGLEKGAREGEKKKALEIIREMGRKGMDVGLIADVVKMPLEDVRRILQ